MRGSVRIRSVNHALRKFLALYLELHFMFAGIPQHIGRLGLAGRVGRKRDRSIHQRMDAHRFISPYLSVHQRAGHSQHHAAGRFHPLLMKFSMSVIAGPAAGQPGHGVDVHRRSDGRACRVSSLRPRHTASISQSTNKQQLQHHDSVQYFSSPARLAMAQPGALPVRHTPCPRPRNSAGGLRFPYHVLSCA